LQDTGGHYVHDLLDPLSVYDNSKRPGRYILIQKLEWVVFGKAESSLRLGFYLKEHLGDSKPLTQLQLPRSEDGSSRMDVQP
jgi:hypothetical protein